MLEEDRQLELAETLPRGMQDLPIHLILRREIEDQQQWLAELNDVSEQISPPDPNIQQQLEQHISYRWGVTELSSEHLYKNHHIPQSHKRVIVVVVQIDYQAMLTAPSLESATAILRSYRDAGAAVIELTSFIRESGYEAMGHHPLGDVQQYHHLLLPPHAMAAGLGEQGRTGLFIDYKLGSAVRVGAVTTNAPLEIRNTEKIGITEFCHRCRYCVAYCPPKALPDGTYLEQVVLGKPITFTINAHRCFQYFKEHQGCGRCVVNCILAGPDQNAISRRMERIQTWYQAWIVSGKLDEMYNNLGNK